MADRVIFEFKAEDGGKVRWNTAPGWIWPCGPIINLCGDVTVPLAGHGTAKHMRETLDALERLYQELYGTNDDPQTV